MTYTLTRAPGSRTAGLDLYLVENAGRVVVTFPDRPGLTAEETYHYAADREQLIATLAAAGMLTVGTRPASLYQADTETDAAFAARETARLRDTRGAGAGIAWHKLRGDDAAGWWVTAQECRAALTTAATADSHRVDRALVEFLTRAAEHGGFRVWATW